MEKDFDGWNKEKKRINKSELDKFYRERQIWWCSLGLNIGFEQDGTGDRNQRPVLILKGFSEHVCFILPLTTSQKKNKYYISVGKVENKSAAVIVSQLRLIDTRRLVDFITFLDEKIFEEIRKSVKNLF